MGGVKDLLELKYYRNTGRNKTNNNHMKKCKGKFRAKLKHSKVLLCYSRGRQAKWTLNFKKYKLQYVVLNVTVTTKRIKMYLIDFKPT